MITQDQLEIINPNGEVVFHLLDPDKGITNIGRHPENDIVIDSPEVAPFQAMLDHRQKPYQIIVLSEETPVLMKGQALLPNVSAPLAAWDTLDVGGHALVLLEGTPAPPPPAEATAAPPPTAEVRGPEPKPAGLMALPPDQPDDVILTELSEREWTADVEQTIVGDVTIVNGGDIVATFDVHVQGIDPDWVVVSPPQVNLNEGERATVSFMITPPRLPSSQAGLHHLAIVTTSPNYPDRKSLMGATLTINPYYEFGVGELSPKRQTVSWRENVGQVTLPITNRGNSQVPFRLEAQDDERACNFEFQVPGEQASLARQAELRLSPEQVATVPIQIFPQSRRLVGLRARHYSFTVTVNMLEGAPMPRSLLGQLKAKPLIGPFRVAFILALFVVAIVLIFQPRIFAFDLYPATGIVQAGDPVTLQWQVSPFVTNLEIENVGSVKSPSGEESDFPQESAVTYVIKADNLLSQILPSWLNLSKKSSESVIVLPRLPQIDKFSVEDEHVLNGETTNLNWSVQDADELVLTANDVSDVIPIEEHIGQRDVMPDRNTLYVLEARNSSGTDLKSLVVWVNTPDLAIPYFDVRPPVINAGDSVTITWVVTGAQSVTIAPLPDERKPRGSLPYAPPETTDFILTASNGDSEISEKRRVIVIPEPTPTPEPEPPVIEFFTATPSEIVEGDDNDVHLAWAVTGQTTDIEITSLGGFTQANLQPRDIISLTLSDPDLFVLTAYNGDLSASEAIEIKTLAPTPPPDRPPRPGPAPPGPIVTPIPGPTFTPTPRPSPTPTPDVPPRPNIIHFQAEAIVGSSAPIRFRRRYQDESGPVFVYQAPLNAQVRLDWQVQHADTVSLNAEGQSSVGNTVVTVEQQNIYQLWAHNAAGSASAFIKIEHAYWSYLPLVRKRR